METFTSGIPQLRGLTFSSTGIIWNENGSRRAIYAGHGHKPHIVVKEQRYYLDDVYKEAGYEYKADL